MEEKELKEHELEKVNGGTTVGGVCGPSYPKINNNEYIGHPSPDTDTVCICGSTAKSILADALPPAADIIEELKS